MDEYFTVVYGEKMRVSTQLRTSNEAQLRKIGAMDRGLLNGLEANRASQASSEFSDDNGGHHCGLICRMGQRCQYS